MVIKKYTYTEWMKGKNFVLSGLGMNFERNDTYVSEVIRKSGGIIKSSTVLDTNYLIYDPEHGVGTVKYNRAKELNKTKGKNIIMMTIEDFERKVNDKEKGKEEVTKVGSAICLLQGDQTKCWVQKLEIVYSELPLEDAKLVFEIYNIAHGEYAKAASNDFDTSYSGLYGLDDEIIAARMLMKNNEEISKKYLSSSDDFELSFAEIIAVNPNRYASVKKYFEDADDYFFDFDISIIQPIYFTYVGNFSFSIS